MIHYQNTVRTLKDKVRKRGCEVNVCFAIDTSGSVTASEFELQKDFVLDVTTIIGEDRRTKFAAAQYGDKIRTISRLTGNIGAFNRRVEYAYHQYSPSTSVGMGIVWCDAMLRKQKHDVNKLVLMGDGRNNMGGSPVKRANIFRKRTDNACVSTVGVGYANTHVLKKIAGSQSRVFTVHDYFELSHLVDSLVQDICGFSVTSF